MCVRFNQEQDLIACSTDSGLRIYNVNPLVVKACLGTFRSFSFLCTDSLPPSPDPWDVGTISVVELLHRSNIIALVAGGNRQKYAENTVLVWDDVRKKFVLELTFSTGVLSLRLRKDIIVVCEKTKIHVFSFPSSVRRLLTIVKMRGALWKFLRTSHLFATF